MNSILRIFTFFIYLSTIYCATFTVYKDSGRTSTIIFLWWCTSKQFTVNEGSCVNFNFYNDKISSIDPHNGCIKIWKDANCTGASMIVTEYSGCSKNLAACDISNEITFKAEKRVTWDNEISSISTCSAAEENQANRPADNGDLVEQDLLLINSNKIIVAAGDGLINDVSLNHHRNNYFSVRLCKHIDCKRQERIHAQVGKDRCANFGGDWDREVSAVYILNDCVEMFDGKNCTGQSIKFLRSFHRFLGQQRESCTLNLSRCGWNDRIRSMRSCAN